MFCHAVECHFLMVVKRFEKIRSFLTCSLVRQNDSPTLKNKIMQNVTKRCTPFTLFLFLIIFIACKKTDNPIGPKNETNIYSSEVAQKWQDLQLRFLRIAGTNVFGMNGNRNFAYTGIALYESVRPGMPGYQSLSGQLTDMPQMPSVDANKNYHWPL